MTTHMKLKSIEEVVEQVIDALVTDVHFEKTYPAHTAYHQIDLNALHVKLKQKLKQRDQHLIQTIRKEVEGKKMDISDIKDNPLAQYANRERMGYNQALSDILTLLTTLEGEVSN